MPLNRPLYFDSPKAENAYHNAQEYLLGDNVLAAPIVTAGVGPGRVGTQTVWFPDGDWYNVFTGERFTGGQDRLVAADINEFPLYARGGVPLPMQPYQPRMATAPLTTLRVRCWPGADGKTGRSELYEDDGVTTAYRRGQSAVTPLSYVRRGGQVTVTVGATVGHYRGQPAQRSLVMELPDTAKAIGATLDGRPVADVYDAATFTNRVTVPARPIGKAATLVVQASPAAGMPCISGQPTAAHWGRNRLRTTAFQRRPSRKPCLLTWALAWCIKTKARICITARYMICFMRRSACLMVIRCKS